MVEAPHNDAGEAVEGLHRLRRGEPGSAHQPRALVLRVADQDALDTFNEVLMELIDRRPDQIARRRAADNARGIAICARLDPQARCQRQRRASSRVARHGPDQAERTALAP